MPTITTLFGIIIYMNYFSKEHNPPHLHASYGDDKAMFDIRNGEVIEGKLPKKQTKIVKKFINVYHKELLEMWNTNEFIKL